MMKEDRSSWVVVKVERRVGCWLHSMQVTILGMSNAQEKKTRFRGKEACDGDFVGVKSLVVVLPMDQKFEARLKKKSFEMQEAQNEILNILYILLRQFLSAVGCCMSPPLQQTPCPSHLHIPRACHSPGTEEFRKCFRVKLLELLEYHLFPIKMILREFLLKLPHGVPVC